MATGMKLVRTNVTGDECVTEIGNIVKSIIDYKKLHPTANDMHGYYQIIGACDLAYRLGLIRDPIEAYQHFGNIYMEAVKEANNG